MFGSVKNQVALITGVASGIGKSTAKLLSQQGAIAAACLTSSELVIDGGYKAQ